MSPQLILLENAKAQSVPANEDAYWGDFGKSSDEDRNLVGRSYSPADGDTFTSGIKFDLTGLSGTIGKATLRIYIDEIVDAEDVGGTDHNPFISLYGIDSDASWAGSDMPSIIGSPNPQKIELVYGQDEYKWIEFDVTTFVLAQLAGDKVATFFYDGK